ncbi:MAG: hypothetical protein JWQ11_2896 [Rhizobacter sp.]|nr:hypothetical protein [Rhizobacter sp.]
MAAIDAFWHLLNLLAPAGSVAVIAACMARLLWWRRLKTVSWRRLVGWPACLSALVVVVGLLVSGRDGRIVTYMVMVLACAAGLWWAGWGGRSKG